MKLIPPQYVKPYVRGNKNDYNDALAISEAVVRPHMRFVAVKTTAQQDVQALHRLREKRLADRTALCNQLRGLLAEYGLIMAKGVNTVRRSLPEFLEDSDNGLSDLFRRYVPAPPVGLAIAYHTRKNTGHNRPKPRGRL